MTESVYNRREFIALASLALSVPTISSAFAETSGEVQCLVYDAQGESLPPSALERFHLCDSLMRPFTVAFETDSGRIRFTPPSDKPFRISVPLIVPGFGQVFVYADNSGQGYTARSLGEANPLVLNYALARDSMATVRKVEADCKKLGVVISPETQQRIDSALASLTRAEAARTDRTAQVRASMESLRDSLWAGEMLVISRAQNAIAKRLPRKGFLFGCNGFGLAQGYPETLKQFGAVLTTRRSPSTKDGSSRKRGIPTTPSSKPHSTPSSERRLLPKVTPASGGSQKTPRNGCRISVMTRPNSIALITCARPSAVIAIVFTSGTWSTRHTCSLKPIAA